jgi:hypothetical protein
MGTDSADRLASANLRHIGQDSELAGAAVLGPAS